MFHTQLMWMRIDISLQTPQSLINISDRMIDSIMYEGRFHYIVQIVSYTTLIKYNIGSKYYINIFIHKHNSSAAINILLKPDVGNDK